MATVDVFLLSAEKNKMSVESSFTLSFFDDYRFGVPQEWLFNNF